MLSSLALSSLSQAIVKEKKGLVKCLNGGNRQIPMLLLNLPFYRKFRIIFIFILKFLGPSLIVSFSLVLSSSFILIYFFILFYFKLEYQFYLNIYLFIYYYYYYYLYYYYYYYYYYCYYYYYYC